MRVTDEGVPRRWLGAKVIGTVGAVAVGLMLPAAASAAVSGAVGGQRDPAAGVLELTVLATGDANVGVRSATVVLAGQTLDTAYFGDPACAAGTTIACPENGSVALTVDTTTAADGARRFEVVVEDGNGGVVHLVDRTITVANTPPNWQSSQTVRVGSGATNPRPSPPGGPSNPPPGGTRGCRSPRLSIFLAQAPLRMRRGVPVLRRGRKYRFQGGLTCKIDGRRRPAPKGTVVRVFSRVRGRLVAGPRVKVRDRGKLRVRLAYRTSRTVIFQVRGEGGRLVKVRIPIKVVRVKRGRR